jgi:hypothetical protein
LLTGSNLSILTLHSKKLVKGKKMNKITEKAKELDEVLKADLGNIEMGVLTEGYTLAQAIREGCLVTSKEEGWGTGDTACAMSAAAIAAVNRGFLHL